MAIPQRGGLKIDFPFTPLNFNTAAFNEFLQSQGLTLIHYKSVQCPIGMVDRNDTRAPHFDHANCSNGYLYELAGEVTAYINNNVAVSSIDDSGLYDGSIVQATFPQSYDDNPDKPVSILTYDRFFFKDFTATVPNTQKFEAHITGVDKMTFPIDSVESVWDANGKKYSQADYMVWQGQLKWTGSNRPGYDANLNKGIICSIRYNYRPYFYCGRLIHEIRIAQTDDFITGERKNVRLPYAALLLREYHFLKEEIDTSGLVDQRKALASGRDGMFSPR